MNIVVFFDWCVSIPILKVIYTNSSILFLHMKDYCHLLFRKYPYSTEKIKTNSEIKHVGKHPNL